MEKKISQTRLRWLRMSHSGACSQIHDQVFGAKIWVSMSAMRTVMTCFRRGPDQSLRRTPCGTDVLTGCQWICRIKGMKNHVVLKAGQISFRGYEALTAVLSIGRYTVVAKAINLE